MRQWLLASLVTLLSVPVLSQSDTVTYKIVYDYIMKHGDIALPSAQNIVLHTEHMAVSWLDLSEVRDDGEVGSRVYKGKTAKIQFVFKNFEKNTLVFDAKLGILPKDKTVFEDSLYPMSWQISGEEKVIDSLKCIKATCSFRGREYEAWFCPEIPVREGPWKFGGLPGLIVSINDSEAKYSWKMKTFTISQEPIAPAPPSNGNFEDFKTLFIAGLKKMQEASSASGSSVDPYCIGCGQSVTVNVEMLERF